MDSLWTKNKKKKALSPWHYKYSGSSSLYTKSLVNTISFYTNFTNPHFQKVPIPHLTRTKTEIPSLTRISLHGVLTNLGNMNFFQEPKVALTKELVYVCLLEIGGQSKRWFAMNVFSVSYNTLLQSKPGSVSSF